MSTAAGAPVVVGVDGSPRSLEAVEAAATEAALRHRPLRVVHAFIWPPLSMGIAPGVSGPSPQIFHDEAQRYAAEGLRLAGKVAPEVPATAQIVTGPAVRVLLAESHRAHLLVLGDRGRGDFVGLIIGSVAVQVAAHAACPVLVVRGGHRPSGCVVVGIDGSGNAALALEFAVEEASLRGAELVALHSWNADHLTELNDTLPMTYENWSGDQEERRVLAEALAGICGRYPDVPVRRHVERGSARRMLGDWSRAAQLLVVGSRGHGGFAGLLLGSVSQHLIYRAECPTAVVRPAPVGAEPG